MTQLSTKGVSEFTESETSEVLPVKSDLHISRKLWHMVTGIVGLYLYYTNGMSTFEWALIYFAVGAFGLLYDLYRLKNPALNRWSLKVGSYLYRECEKSQLSGFPFYALGVAVTLLAFSPNISLLAIMYLVVGDPVSSFFGIKYGKTKILEGKSLEGTMAGLIFCGVVTFFYCLNYEPFSMKLVLFSLCGGIVGAVSELFPLKLDDNFTIPILSGFGLMFISHLFNIL